MITIDHHRVPLSPGQKARRINLDPALKWIDIVGVGLLAGIGFTVSLLVTELSFSSTDPHHDHAKVAILTASVVAALVASVLLSARNRAYRKAALAVEPAPQ